MNFLFSIIQISSELGNPNNTMPTMRMPTCLDMCPENCNDAWIDDSNAMSPNDLPGRLSCSNGIRKLKTKYEYF